MNKHFYLAGTGLIPDKCDFSSAIEVSNGGRATLPARVRVFIDFLAEKLA